MAHASQEAIKVAKAFVEGKPAKSPQVTIGTVLDIYSTEKGRRITTDGNEVLSYDWWPIAHRENKTEYMDLVDSDDMKSRVWVTTDRYQTGEWKSGKPKYSPTTDGHIQAVIDALRMSGYEESSKTKECLNDNRRYRLFVQR